MPSWLPANSSCTLLTGIGPGAPAPVATTTWFNLVRRKSSRCHGLAGAAASRSLTAGGGGGITSRSFISFGMVPLAAWSCAPFGYFGIAIVYVKLAGTRPAFTRKVWVRGSKTTA